MALAALLRTGRCTSRKGKHTAKNVVGKKFAMLTSLYPIEERSRNGSVVKRSAERTMTRERVEERYHVLTRADED